MRLNIFSRKDISLRWKWAFYLSIVFFGLYVAISYFMLFFMKQQLYATERELVKDYSNELSSILMRTKTDTLEHLVEDVFHHNETKENQLIPHYLNLDGVQARVLDKSGRVIFESIPLPHVQFSPNQYPEISELSYNNRTHLVTVRPLLSEKAPDKTPRGYLQLVFTLEDYYQRVGRLNDTYIIVSLIACLVSICIGNLLAYIFFKPIKHMTDIMTDFKVDAFSKKRMHISKGKQDELTDLSIGFNELLDKMDLYINQQKQFVEDVSHELRTPVAIVEGHLTLLNRWGKDDPSILEESLSASLSEINRMKTLVQEMLDLSRAEQVGINYKNELTEVVGLTEQVHQNVQLIHPEFRIRLEKDDIDETEIWVSISRHHLEQVLIILLDNAIKYSTDVPHIHLSISKTLTNVQISVQDFGEGISSQDLPKVFGRFYRVDKARSRHKGGNGLGLSIAKELIEGYKGSISVESVINSGTTFRIEMPIVTDSVRVVQEKRKRKEENLIK